MAQLPLARQSAYGPGMSSAVAPRRARVPLFLAMFALLALPGGALHAQSRSDVPPGARAADQHAVDERERLLRVARDIMRAARFCALITRDATVGAAARTIDPAPPDSAMIVRFVTNPRSRKVRQLAADARVTLYYFDAAAQRYTTVYGRAVVISNPSEKARRWYEGWTPFYPQREREATLYEVIPDRIELVSPADRVLGDSLSWATPTIRFPSPRRAR